MLRGGAGGDEKQVINCAWPVIQPINQSFLNTKLLPKEAAMEDPSQSSTFRPIARLYKHLKVFSNLWFSFMIKNEQSVQNAFMSVTPGCIEHHAKLALVKYPRFTYSPE